MPRRSDSSTSGKIRRRVKVTNRQPRCSAVRSTTLRRPKSTDARSTQSATHQTDEGSRRTNHPSIRFRNRDRRSTLTPDSLMVRVTSGHVAENVPILAGNEPPPTIRRFMVTVSMDMTHCHRHEPNERESSIALNGRNIRRRKLANDLGTVVVN